MPGGGRAQHHAGSHQAVVPADAPGAFADVAGLVNPADAAERSTALAPVAARAVLDHPDQPITVVALAPVLEKELPAVASGAVLPVLAGAVLANMAVGDGSVVLVRALATVVDRRVHDDPAGLAGERIGAAALEMTDAGGGELHRARRGAIAAEQVPAVAADPAGVAHSRTVAPVTVLVQAPAARAGLGATLDPAALAGDRRVAPAGLKHPVFVAGEASAVGAASAAVPLGGTAVAWTSGGGGDRGGGVGLRRGGGGIETDLAVHVESSPAVILGDGGIGDMPGVVELGVALAVPFAERPARDSRAISGGVDQLQLIVARALFRLDRDHRLRRRIAPVVVLLCGRRWRRVICVAGALWQTAAALKPRCEACQAKPKATLISWQCGTNHAPWRW